MMRSLSGVRSDSGRSLHLSTFRLNLSHFVTETTLCIPQKVLPLNSLSEGHVLYISSTSRVY